MSDAPREGEGEAVSLAVVVPAYNEQEQIRHTVQSLRHSLAALGPRSTLVVVDDGSTDRTGEILDELAAGASDLNVIHQPNAGVGGALRTGIARAPGQWLIIWPADMPCTSDDLEPFVTALGSADVIVGCRRQRAGYNPLMRVNAWLYPRLVDLLFGLRLKDVNWVCLYRNDWLQRITIEETGIPMLTEVLVKLRDLGASFREVEVEMRSRSGGTASASRFAIMARTLLGLLTLWARWRRRGGARVPKPSPGALRASPGAQASPRASSSRRQPSD